MTKILDIFRNLSSKGGPIPAGIYHYQAPQDDPRNYRLHLRVEGDGRGVLILNASTILHLNQTAAVYAYCMLKNMTAGETARRVASRYAVSLTQAQADFRDFSERIQTIINTPDLDPVMYLDLERQVPFSGHISAPYRLDCAITYRLPEGAVVSAAPTERVKQELPTKDWLNIIDKAWQAGIPHLIFTGGEPTMRKDLFDLIARAEANSQVTGLFTDGLRLAKKEFLEKLLQTGLDHLMILLDAENEQTWAALKNVLAEDIYVAVHLTVQPENASRMPSLIEQLVGMGAKALSLSASDTNLFRELELAREQATNRGVELVWNLPVPYSTFNPVSLETKHLQLPDGAGRAWMYVEPDGDVLPTQGSSRVLGNLLNDPWDTIWKST